MINLMNDTDSNIHTFSFQTREYAEEHSLEESLLALRFHLVDLLNLVAVGKIEINEIARKNIRLYNRYCKMIGHKPLKESSHEQ